MPEISVIVPVYKAEKYIERCVKSIVSQTYENFELILINDGSPDNSGKICDDLAQKDDRIIVIHKQNGGVAETRNVGIDIARGTYIAFVDADDYIQCDMLEKMLACANESNFDIVMCKYFIDKKGIITLATMSYEKRYNNIAEVREKLLYRYYTENHNGLYSLCNKLIRRELYIKNDIKFDVNLKRGEDAWFIFYCLKHAERVAFLDDGYYYYCQNEDSIMHTLQLNQYEVWVQSRKHLLSENEELNYKIDYSIFYKQFLYNIAVFCRELMNKGYSDKVVQIITDPFYLNAVEYMGKFPLHIKLLHKMAKYRLRRITLLCYKLWGTIDGR